MGIGDMGGNRMGDYFGLGHFMLAGAFFLFFAVCGYIWIQPPAEPPAVRMLSQQELQEIAGDAGDGWFKDEGGWYYYQDGKMVKNQWIDDTYYVGEDGIMLHDTTTPDGYAVGADGALVSE